MAPRKEDASRFLPVTRTLATLTEAVTHCKGCPIHETATQAVFGEGDVRARLMMVGEQPGDHEDLAGRPFVGPAGKLLDQALTAAGITRETAYVTNVVKHFKFEPRGKRRIHQKPNAAEIFACTPWLVAEIEAVQPTVLVCLGSTAAQAILGKAFRVTTQRGEILKSPLVPKVPHVVATMHPSSLLRTPDPQTRELELARLIADLRVAAEILGSAATLTLQ